MIRRFATVALASLLAGCVVATFGSGWNERSLARRAAGARITLQTQRTGVGGELLAVRDSAFLVLGDGERVVLVPYRAILGGEVEDLGKRFITAGGIPSAGARERLRLISRFPQGVSPELLPELLLAYGQSELAVVRP